MLSPRLDISCLVFLGDATIAAAFKALVHEHVDGDLLFHLNTAVNTDTEHLSTATATATSTASTSSPAGAAERAANPHPNHHNSSSSSSSSSFPPRSRRLKVALAVPSSRSQSQSINTPSHHPTLSSHHTTPYHTTTPHHTTPQISPRNYLSYTLSSHTLSSYTLSSHTLSSHILSSHTLSPHIAPQVVFALRPGPLRLITNFPAVQAAIINTGVVDEEWFVRHIVLLGAFPLIDSSHYHHTFR